MLSRVYSRTIVELEDTMFVDEFSLDGIVLHTGGGTRRLRCLDFSLLHFNLQPDKVSEIEVKGMPSTFNLFIVGSGSHVQEKQTGFVSNISK